MKQVIHFTGIIAGNFILAFAVAAFVLPDGLIAGGTTGLALSAQHYLGISVPAFVAISNIVLFLLGLICMGIKFALTTLISTFLYPTLLGILKSISVMQNMTDNLLLSAIFAGTLMGLGVGLVLKMGASTGGFDIPPLVLNKKYNIPVSLTLYIIDTIIILAQVTFSTPEQILYGIIVVFLCSVTVNKVLISGTGKIQLLIVSEHYEKIRETFLYNLDCGITMVQIETGLQGQSQQAVLCVISNRKLNEAKMQVHQIDEKAFIMISSVTEVQGRGFTLERQIKITQKEN